MLAGIPFDQSEGFKNGIRKTKVFDRQIKAREKSR